MSVLRSIARNRAKMNMKRRGMHRICSKRGGYSYFANNWRDYV